MGISFRWLKVAGLALCVVGGLAGSTGLGQSSTPAPATGLQKQLDRMDLALSGAGEFGTTVTGTNYLKQTISDQPSTTLEGLATLRFTRSPYVGFEANASYARYVQNYSVYVPGGVQARVDEYTIGYIVHPKRTFMGLEPFAGAGLGTISYKPTPFGGQGLMTQYKAAYYYTVGADDYSPAYHVGLRASFRQVISLAPDFGQNYLTITRRTVTSEPTIGFFLRF